MNMIIKYIFDVDDNEAIDIINFLNQLKKNRDLFNICSPTICNKCDVLSNYIIRNVGYERNINDRTLVCTIDCIKPFLLQLKSD